MGFFGVGALIFSKFFTGVGTIIFRGKNTYFMAVFKGVCNFILPSGVRTKGRSSTGGVRILNAIAHSAKSSDYLCMYKLTIRLYVKCTMTGTAYLQRLGKIQLCRFT